MKISYTPYTLVALAGGQRRGALFQVEHKDGSVGYCDCHPWVERGDASLEEQLRLLSQGKTTSLTERSLYFALHDAMARAQGVSLFENLEIPPSHWLIPNLENCDAKQLSDALGRRFTRFKVKLGKNLEQELKLLIKLWKQMGSKELTFCLDFNLSLTLEQFEQVLKTLAPLKSQIAFHEDPFPFDPAVWQGIQKKGVTLACDYRSEEAIGYPSSAKVLVVKPALQDEAIFLPSLQPDHRLVITSYLDHPVGQLGAAYVAALCLSKDPDKIDLCGLLTHLVYQPNAFSEQLRMEGPVLIPPKGTGFGYDTLLSSLTWEVLYED